MSVEVRDNPEDQQYEVFSDGRLAGFARYRLGGGAITMFHTEIDSEFEGQGLGSELARGALADVRARGLELIPLCPFISRFIRRHPDEYLDLVAPRIRESWADA
jgi:predicted GNAT family acetyltransferase